MVFSLAVGNLLLSYFYFKINNLFNLSLLRVIVIDRIYEGFNFHYLISLLRLIIIISYT